MKSKTKWTLVVILICVLQMFFIPFSGVGAEEASKGTSMDVIFALDSSGSMAESDPEKIREEAIKMFLDMGQIQGNKAGLVAYSDSIVREHNLDSINSSEDRDRIKSMASNISLGQKTDTGRGLLEAVKLMESGHKSGNNPVIILLSDGKNDPERSQDESLNDLKNALQICKSKGYPVYTIGLNYNGTVDKTQLGDISSSTGGKNYITNTASDLPAILTDIYADNSKLKVQDGGTIKANGDFQELKVNIPNSNVLEANISMLSSTPVEVKLLNPSGSEVSIPSENTLFTSSNKYSMLKLINPVKGQWTVKVKGVSGNDIKVSYIFNYDIQLKAAFTPENPGKGDKMKIEAYFTSNGNKVTDEELYKNAGAKLIVKNLKDSLSKEIPLISEDNLFKGEYSYLEEGKYELKVRVDGDSFYRESNTLVIGDNTGVGTPKAQPKSFIKNPIILTVIGIILAAICIYIIIIVIKKKRIRGFGRIELNIRDENTGEALSPQFRNLDNYTGSFTLFDVLGLKEEYAETESIKFIFKKDDSIELINKSNCTLQRSGKILENNSGIILYNGNKIKVFLNKVPKSILVEFHAK
ncbi:VWA domain-containing protein [Clostridium sp. BJN0013]|uniref:vWA domain-containing protein n=1 Tax=Clostridium sp. BJN0013 TaxID=3236840 RepID=UPI0034C6A1A4